MSKRRKRPNRLDPAQVSIKKESRIGSFGTALLEALKGTKRENAVAIAEEKKPVISRQSSDRPISRLSQAMTAAVTRPTKSDFSFTQYDKKKLGVETELVIGFDFGTSSSKIIIQDVDRRQAYAIPFPAIAPNGHDYLLPTKVFVNENGEFSLSGKEHELTLLKSKLFAGTSHAGNSNHPNLQPEIVAIAYLALALRAARKYFITSIAKDVVPGTIVWSINVGLPEKYRQQEKTQLLEICALAGWECSVWNESVTIELAQYWFEEIRRAKSEKPNLSYMEDEGRDLHPDQVIAVPEVVAQVQGYARSDLRRTGLHMMVDVGAATLDASTFTLFDRDHEDRYTIWEAQVALLGALSLHMHRLRGVSKSLNAHIHNLIGNVDTVSPTPSREDLVPEITEEDIYRIESDFADKAGMLLAKMITDTHTKKNPIAHEWDDGLRVFLCGGGRGIPLYRQRLERLPGANGHSGPYSWLAPFQFVDLPKPDNLLASKLVPSEYHRLAVAYGLSFRVDDIGRFEQGSEIEAADEKSAGAWRSSFISKDQI